MAHKPTRSAVDRTIDNIFLQHAVGAINTPAARYRVLDVLTEVRKISKEANIDELETEIDNMFKSLSATNY